jgi:beta-lactamase superfamily II metal-dependent hydrolase
MAGKGREPGYLLDAGEIARLKVLARGADALAAAHKLDDMINSTSLVLVLQIGAARLLLPGDAEWGTWKIILANEDARALLRGATFFKVGHHGSHNATSKTLVEQVLPKKIPALISTQEGEGNYRNDIPLRDLLDALTARDIRFMRSDKPKAKFTGGFSKGAGGQWIDLELPC